jgi:hypothetical protein
VLLLGPNGFIQIGRDMRRQVQCCIEIGWGKREKYMEGMIAFNNVITVSWNWLPKFFYYHSYTFWHHTGYTTVAARWTGRWETLGWWYWPFNFYWHHNYDKSPTHVEKLRALA